MTVEALELEIERAWVAMANFSGQRTLYLCESGRLRWGWVVDRQAGAHEVGTYRQDVALSDLREDVFFIYETTHGRRRA